MACDSLGCQSQGRAHRHELVAERRQGVGLNLRYQITFGYEHAHNNWIVNERKLTTHAVAPRLHVPGPHGHLGLASQAIACRCSATDYPRLQWCDSLKSSSQYKEGFERDDSNSS